MDNGLRIRAADREDCRDLGVITVAASLGAFIGRIPEHLLDLTWTPTQSAKRWERSLADLDPGDLFDLAEHRDDGVVGFVWAGPSPRDDGEVGEIRGLYVLPTQQRRGIGRGLVAHAVRHLRANSMTALVIGCVAENPSCDFYRHLGGMETLRRPAMVDRYETEEIIFSWPDSNRVL